MCFIFLRCTFQFYYVHLKLLTNDKARYCSKTLIFLYHPSFNLHDLLEFHSKILVGLHTHWSKLKTFFVFRASDPDTKSEGWSAICGPCILQKWGQLTPWTSWLRSPCSTDLSIWRVMSRSACLRISATSVSASAPRAHSTANQTLQIEPGPMQCSVVSTRGTAGRSRVPGWVVSTARIGSRTAVIKLLSQRWWIPIWWTTHYSLVKTCKNIWRSIAVCIGYSRFAIRLI